MNCINILVDKLIHGFVGQIIDQLTVHQVQMAGDVFSLAVKTCRHRNVFISGIIQRSFAEEERRHDMNGIRSANGLFQNVVVRNSDRNADFPDIRVQRADVQLRNDKEALLAPTFIIRTDHPNLMTALFQKSNQIHRSDRCPIVFFSKDIAGNYDLHAKGSFLLFDN